MTGITSAQAKRRTTCPQCRRLRFIPRALAPFCTRTCQRAAEAECAICVPGQCPGPQCPGSLQAGAS